MTGIIRNAGIGAVTAALLCATAAPAGAATSPNLIKNGNAEAGAGGTGQVVPIPNWTRKSGSHFTVVKYGTPPFPSATDPGPPDRAKNFFFGGHVPGGDAAHVEKAKQIISLSSFASKIDGGSVTFTLSGYFGGFTFQEDNAVMKITWRNSAGSVIGSSTSVGGVTAADRSSHTGLLFRSTAGTVPVGARSVKVKVICTKGNPVSNNHDNDGYADDLSLVLHDV